MTTATQLYAYGMLCCGYAAGKRGPHEWISTPWQVDFAIGCGLIILTFIVGRLQERKGS